ncbi:MFS transporter [Chloroflexota bacterium]
MVETKKSAMKKVLPIASAVTFIGFLDTHLLIPVIALYASKLGASVGIIGLIVGLYSLTNTPANIVCGRLVDRFGRKLPLILGLVGDALSMFFYSLCRLPVHLALVRVVHGITGGMVGPATMSIVADYADESGRGRSMSFYGMSIAAATLVGYGLSGVIVSRLGYKVLFLIGTAILTVGAVISMLLPGGGARDTNAFESQHDGYFQKAKELLKRKGLAISYGSVFAHYFAFGGVVTLLPLYVKSLGMEALHVGILMAIFSVFFIVSQFPAGVIADKTGRFVPVITGLTLSIVALVVMSSVTALPLLAAVMALYGAAFGLLFPAISALIADNTRSEERGVASGIFHALLTAGVAIGAPIIGWAGGTLGVETGMVLSSGIILLALLFVLVISRRI